MAMYGDIHDKVRDVKLSEQKNRAADIRVEEDLCHVDNVVDCFTKIDEWDMEDEATKRLVETFQAIREKFVLAKRIIERARVA